MLTHWIWLATRTGLGDKSKAELLERYEEAESIYFATDLPKLPAAAEQSLMDKDLTQCETILARCLRDGIHILTMQDAAYPNRLRSIPDPPPVLYYRGSLPDFDAMPVIGVVGTRKASSYGLTMANRLGYQIAACGGTVVSGMAAGIDGVAAKAALTAGGTVVGILGCGADVVYPASHRSLYADVEHGGCLLTEFPPGTPPMGKNFPRRNRIISGLSCGVLVVEAPKKSGALITAKLALDQGRDVFVVPANADNDIALGSNALLREGAVAVSSGWEILEEYLGLYPGKIRRTGNGLRLSLSPEELSQEREQPAKVAAPRKKPAPKSKSVKKVIDNGGKPPYSDCNKTPAALKPEEEEIVSQLRQGKRLVDDVIAQTGKPAGQVLATITVLQVRGILRKLPGRYLEWTGK